MKTLMVLTVTGFMVASVAAADAQKCGATWVSPDGMVHTCVPMASMSGVPPAKVPLHAAPVRLGPPTVPVNAGRCDVKVGDRKITITHCVPAH